MNCPLANRDPNNKPKGTKKKDYIWKEIFGNPNIYCWVPISTDLLNTDPEVAEVNIQDLPIIETKDVNPDIIKQIAESAERLKEKTLARKKNESISQMVSYDDPSKYKLVREFIKEKGLKVYGGVAVNSYLPREAKIYNPSDVPDYDFLSPDPWNDAVALADVFHDHNYQFVEAKAGIHKGTYKVFVDLWPVADITYVPKYQFDQIKTKTIRGIKIVSPFKLLESMYKEFSEPFSNPLRWEKIATRQKLLLHWTNPLGKKVKCSKSLFLTSGDKLDPIQLKLLESSYRFIINKKLLLGGSIAYNTFIEIGGGSKRIANTHYTAFSEDSLKDMESLFSDLLPIYKHLDIETSYYPARELNNNSRKLHAVIEIDGIKHRILICEMIQLTSCTPYLYLLGRYVVSIDYVFYQLYEQTIYGENKQEIKDTICKLKYLTYIQQAYYDNKGITEVDKSPFQRFIINCRGVANAYVKVAILHRVLEREARTMKIIHEWTPIHKIQKIPHEPISKMCKDKHKEMCKYPCYWNKYIGKCTDMLRNVYNPADKQENI